MLYVQTAKRSLANGSADAALLMSLAFGSCRSSQQCESLSSALTATRNTCHWIAHLCSRFGAALCAERCESDFPSSVSSPVFRIPVDTSSSRGLRGRAEVCFTSSRPEAPRADHLLLGSGGWPSDKRKLSPRTVLSARQDTARLGTRCVVSGLRPLLGSAGRPVPACQGACLRRALPPWTHARGCSSLHCTS